MKTKHIIFAALTAICYIPLSTVMYVPTMTAGKTFTLTMLAALLIASNLYIVGHALLSVTKVTPPTTRSMVAWAMNLPATTRSLVAWVMNLPATTRSMVTVLREDIAATTRSMVDGLKAVFRLALVFTVEHLAMPLFKLLIIFVVLALIYLAVTFCVMESQVMDTYAYILYVIGCFTVWGTIWKGY